MVKNNAELTESGDPRCQERVWSDWSDHQCPNRAKFGDRCGVHAPERKAARKRARGPTQYERELAAIGRKQERLEALENVLDTARAFLSGNSYPPVTTVEMNAAVENYDAVIERHARERGGN